MASEVNTTYGYRKGYLAGTKATALEGQANLNSTLDRVTALVERLELEVDAATYLLAKEIHANWRAGLKFNAAFPDDVDWDDLKVDSKAAFVTEARQKIQTEMADDDG